MKKILNIALILILLFILSSCIKENKNMFFKDKDKIDFDDCFIICSKKALCKLLCGKLDGHDGGDNGWDECDDGWHNDKCDDKYDSKWPEKHHDKHGKCDCHKNDCCEKNCCEKDKYYDKF